LRRSSSEKIIDSLVRPLMLSINRSSQHSHSRISE
jgi:hypothetical protein